jgi:uncharacterized protein (DUF58 family)
MQSPTREDDPRAVRFPDGFVRRLEQLVARVAASRTRGEGMGASRLVGAGDELVGHRPYRPGEELRHLDWNLLARLDRPFVRVHRREAGERWALLLDASGSMGLGRPGKLQLAAEVVTGLAFAGLRAGARTGLFVRGPTGTGVCQLRQRADLGAWLSFLGALTAGGEDGVRTLLREPRLASADRVFIVGDLLDVEPPDVLALARRGRDLATVQLLAPHELAPSGERDVRWIDPESGEELDVAADPELRTRYERALAETLEAWRRAAGTHRVVHGCWSSAVPFEDVVHGVLGD